MKSTQLNRCRRQRQQKPRLGQLARLDFLKVLFPVPARSRKPNQTMFVCLKER